MVEVNESLKRKIMDCRDSPLLFHYFGKDEIPVEGGFRRLFPEYTYILESFRSLEYDLLNFDFDSLSLEEKKAYLCGYRKISSEEFMSLSLGLNGGLLSKAQGSIFYKRFSFVVPETRKRMIEFSDIFGSSIYGPLCSLDDLVLILPWGYGMFYGAITNRPNFESPFVELQHISSASEELLEKLRQGYLKSSVNNRASSNWDFFLKNYEYYFDPKINLDVPIFINCYSSFDPRNPLPVDFFQRLNALRLKLEQYNLVFTKFQREYFVYKSEDLLAFTLPKFQFEMSRSGEFGKADVVLPSYFRRSYFENFWPVVEKGSGKIIGCLVHSKDFGENPIFFEPSFRSRISLIDLCVKSKVSMNQEDQYLFEVRSFFEKQDLFDEYMKLGSLMGSMWGHHYASKCDHSICRGIWGLAFVADGKPFLKYHPEQFYSYTFDFCDDPNQRLRITESIRSKFPREYSILEEEVKDSIIFI
jgi:hypothetical protein